MMDREDYVYACKSLSATSIGKHVRHSVEMYTCLIDNYNDSVVDYSLRKRDTVLETLPEYASQSFKAIAINVAKEDKPITVINEGIAYNSSYNRELLYCNEHLIHHLALIKIGLAELNKYNVSANFGVAPSTVKYRESCAQ
ncbi:MAG: hypothetical protein C0459_09885 [Chitinophaga sp.]|nr:hypothetical protein [Chitinophaga sp.]